MTDSNWLPENVIAAKKCASKNFTCSTYTRGGLACIIHPQLSWHVFVVLFNQKWWIMSGGNFPRNPKTTMDLETNCWWIRHFLVSWCFKITKPFQSSRVETTSFNTRKSPLTGISDWRFQTFSYLLLKGQNITLPRFQTLMEKKSCQTASIDFFGFVSVTINEGLFFFVDSLSQHLQLLMLWPLMWSNHPTKGRVLKKWYL